jgi:muramoyltetrapeptide carboxypeptidase
MGVKAAPKTRAGLTKVRPVNPGSQVALIAPASPFDRAEFDLGLAELQRIGLVPVFDEEIFAREDFVAGPADGRAAQFLSAVNRDDVDAVLAVRGGYGSMEMLPFLGAEPLRARRTAFVGYSDTTSLHAFLNCHAGVTSVHGAMIDGRIARGERAFDERSFLGSLSAEPLGELTAPGVEVLSPGEVSGPLFGGTLTQIAHSLGTPYAFAPPPGALLFLEDVGERPYRIRRLLVHLEQAGVFRQVGGVVFGEFLRCDEAGAPGTARGVLAAFARRAGIPCVFGFPSGHTAGPMVSLPFGVDARIVADSARPRLVLEEAAAG